MQANFEGPGGVSGNDPAEKQDDAVAVSWLPAVIEPHDLFPAVRMRCEAEEPPPYDGVILRRLGGPAEAAEVEFRLFGAGGESGDYVMEVNLLAPSRDALKYVVETVEDAEIKPLKTNEVRHALALLRRALAGVSADPAQDRDVLSMELDRNGISGDLRFPPAPIIEPGHISLVYAAGGQGKTWSGMWASAEWLGQSPENGVVWISTEPDRAEDDRDRMAAVMSGHSVSVKHRTALLDEMRTVHLAYQRVSDAIETMVANGYTKILVVVDSSTRAVSVNSQQAIDALFDLVGRWGQYCGADLTWLCMHHQSKADTAAVTGGKSASAASPTGNSAWRDRPQLVLSIRAHEPDDIEQEVPADADMPPAVFEIQISKSNHLPPATSEEVAFAKERRVAGDLVQFSRRRSGMSLTQLRGGDIRLANISPMVWHGIRQQMAVAAKARATASEEEKQAKRQAKAHAANEASTQMMHELVAYIRDFGEKAPSAAAKALGYDYRSSRFERAVDRAVDEGLLVRRKKEKGAGDVLLLPEVKDGTLL